MAGDRSQWVSSEPFTEEDFKRNSDWIDARRGRKFAVLECFEDIPCDPCGEACPQKAITVASITDLPVLDWDRCTGCGNCIANCPGQAIIVLDTTNPDWDVVLLPYEYLPLPGKGRVVTAVDRRGNPVGPAEVLGVIDVPANARTCVIRLKVPRGLGAVVRGMTM